MSRLLVPLLAAAIFAGILGSCATAPTAEGYEREARKNYAQKHKQPAIEKRTVVLKNLSFRWDAFRSSASLSQERLLRLKGDCMVARENWNGETKRLLLGDIREFAERELIVFFRQMLYDSRELEIVLSAIDGVTADMHALVRCGAITHKERALAWGFIESEVQTYR